MPVRRNHAPVIGAEDFEDGDGMDFDMDDGDGEGMLFATLNTVLGYRVSIGAVLVNAVWGLLFCVLCTSVMLSLPALAANLFASMYR